MQQLHSRCIHITLHCDIVTRHLLLSLTAVTLLQESVFRYSCVECYCSAAMVTCNLYCDTALQCGIGDVKTAVCVLHYGLLQRSNGDLQFALCK